MRITVGATGARCEGATEGARKGLISAVGLYCNYTYNTYGNYNGTFNRHRLLHRNAPSAFGIGCSSLNSLGNRNGAFGGSCAGRRWAA